MFHLLIQLFQEPNRSSCPLAPLCMQIVWLFILLHLVYDNSIFSLTHILSLVVVFSFFFVVTFSSFLNQSKTKHRDDDDDQQSTFNSKFIQGTQSQHARESSSYGDIYAEYTAVWQFEVSNLTRFINITRCPINWLVNSYSFH